MNLIINPSYISSINSYISKPQEVSQITHPSNNLPQIINPGVYKSHGLAYAVSVYGIFYGSTKKFRNFSIQIVTSKV